MGYISRYNELDLLIPKLQALIVLGLDPMVESTFGGLVAVKAVTAFELSVKDILEEFSSKKHRVFGIFVSARLGRLNGRILFSNLTGEIVKPFGDKYLRRFNQKTKEKTAEVMKRDGVDLVTTYNNLILCRHQLVHGGTMTLTFQEAVTSYQIGKIVLNALDEAMKR